MKRTRGQSPGVFALAAAAPGRAIMAAAALAALSANCAVVFADGASWPWAVKLLAVKWLFSCGIGFCVWRLTRHLPVSLALAASVQFIGFFMYRGDPRALFSLCCSPWVLYLWLGAVDCSSNGASLLWIAGLLGVNVAEMSGGTSREAWILLLWMNFSGACVLLVSARSLREKFRLVCALAAAAAVFVVIGLQAWPASFRALRDLGLAGGAPRAFQIQPGLFVGLFDGAFLRPFQVYSEGANPSSNFFILTGLLWCLVRWRSTLSDRRAAALAVSSLPALMLVFGVIPPEVIGRVPYLAKIVGVDEAFSPILIILFAVLAGFGWREAWQRLGSADGRREGAAVLMLLVLVYASYLGTAQAIVRSAYSSLTWGEYVRLGRFAEAYGWILVAASATLMWAMRRSLRPGSLGIAAAVCAVLSLGALHWRMAPRPASSAPAFAATRAKQVDPRP
jgi:hypothetical protein